ncbi:MAG: bifunctional (p)ppGpp synthetase/guanosine-3',5'-bis(diphosphate) 3'-pyrophosphohydrolase [Bacteroidaceae bacterium]|nr:bifunctional (p)ppGpp synthetase/guanosine-3',5'-bis(diphosphate) 3'-pyrophosphohydrolase [Bacteroidaceae bacterium]
MEELNSHKIDDERCVDEAFQDLLEGYLRSNHRKKIDIIKRAFNFAREAHKGVRRRSGEPYIMHPIAVARIVSQEIGLGSTSICAALLHDVVEDTDYTVEDIENLFGAKIASIVEGLTKISGGIVADHISLQTENFRKLLLTMSEDIRVIIIKIADRLHNMRTLDSMSTAKQYKIAGETIYIYAPLAHRLGLYAIKSELEDLSFKFEHPESYEKIKRQIADSESNRHEMYAHFAGPIEKRLKERGFVYTMKARVKSVYSIWKKMQAKHINFEEVYDLFAVRIVFECPEGNDEADMCWAIYNIITQIYHPHPERTRNWLATPKPNGYKALHVTVMGPDGNWIEVQIRSQRMDEIAERGLAAHWKYKTGDHSEDSELNVWIENIKNALDNPSPDAMDMLSNIKMNLYSNEIFVFTPKGDLITLPKDATVLDLAFTLHSDLGFHCIAAKVNHKLVPMTQKLRSGDQVEILTSKSQSPKADWIEHVTTAVAKSRLAASLRKDRRQIIAIGEKMFNDFLTECGMKPGNEIINRALGRLGFKTPDAMFYKIGSGGITIDDNLRKQLQYKNSGNKLMQYLTLGLARPKEDSLPELTDDPKESIDRKQTYILRNENGVPNYHIAECCHPIPGDEVLGIVEPGEQSVIVHKQECPEAMKIKSSYGSRIVSTMWQADNEQSFPVMIEIRGIDRKGMLNDITNVVTNGHNVNMRSLNINAEQGVFIGKLSINVHNTSDVTKLCTDLRKIKGMKNAVRINE